MYSLGRRSRYHSNATQTRTLLLRIIEYSLSDLRQHLVLLVATRHLVLERLDGEDGAELRAGGEVVRRREEREVVLARPLGLEAVLQEILHRRAAEHLALDELALLRLCHPVLVPVDLSVVPVQRRDDLEPVLLLRRLELVAELGALRHLDLRGLEVPADARERRAYHRRARSRV